MGPAPDHNDNQKERLRKKILAAAVMILSAFALTVSGVVPADAKAKKHSKSSKSKSNDADKPADQSPEPAQK